MAILDYYAQIVSALKVLYVLKNHLAFIYVKDKIQMYAVLY
jgi:hypothetical protein